MIELAQASWRYILRLGEIGGLVELDEYSDNGISDADVFADQRLRKSISIGDEQAMWLILAWLAEAPDDEDDIGFWLYLEFRDFWNATTDDIRSNVLAMAVGNKKLGVFLAYMPYL